MPAALQLFVALVMIGYGLALLCFVVNEVRLQLRDERAAWRVVYRNGSKSGWASRAQALAAFQTWDDATGIENEFGVVEKPRRIRAGGTGEL